MARVLVNHVTPMPDRITGMTAYAWRIVEALGRTGRNEYVLATNWSEDKVPAAIRAAGVEVVSRPLPRSELASMVLGGWRMPRLRRHLGCDLVFHPQPTGALGSGALHVIVLHDLYRVTHPDLYSKKQRLQWHHVIARSFRRAGRVIAVSDTTRLALIEAYPDMADRIRVVHEAAALDTGPAVHGVAADDPYLLMVANVTPNKNIAVLFEALEMLAARGSHPRVVLAGRDDSRTLPALATAFPQATVTLAGSVDDSALVALYRGAAGYINTSLIEGFCLPVVEAHMAGLPVICSDIPVLREVAGDGALFFDPRSPTALADAIAQLLSSPETAAGLRQRAAANGMRFSWEKAAIETETVFDELLAPNSAARFGEPRVADRRPLRERR